jgi:peroxiredoxin
MPVFDLPDANGDTVPLLSDSRRQMTKAYGVLRDDPTMLENPQ